MFSFFFHPSSAYIYEPVSPPYLCNRQLLFSFLLVFLFLLWAPYQFSYRNKQLSFSSKGLVIALSVKTLRMWVERDHM